MRTEEQLWSAAEAIANSFTFLTEHNQHQALTCLSCLHWALNDGHPLAQMFETLVTGLASVPTLTTKENR